jgi:hypothetical protein
MTFQELFTEYYTLYRAEATVPSTTDDEYTIAMRFANNALNRWANYDGVYWKELFETNSNDGSGSQTVVTDITEYDGPDNMREAGGSIKILDSSNKVVQHYPIIEPQDAQFKSDNSTYAFFTGDPSNGFVLHLNPAPPSSLNGNQIEYVYYKNPTEFTTGGDVSECANSRFLINHMLSNRFRASRNTLGYQTSLRDAEEALKNMKQDNDSGTWSNPWKVADHSGAVWGF